MSTGHLPKTGLFTHGKQQHPTKTVIEAHETEPINILDISPGECCTRQSNSRIRFQHLFGGMKIPENQDYIAR
ncbi:hypothetical protein Nepgr_009395 [Nepenthes gracilis]|uniref:Uncharacterized protein n=1 Tax=Nepenthes gracilis TaxID=150966 RepID=A0AAD3SAY5_NEPGR|nr:hypothetical protein Nepgr_009395 [Nepenthes gracilis]